MRFYLLSKGLKASRTVPCTFQQGGRNKQGHKLHLDTETSFRQDMFATSFDEQRTTSISRAKARSLSNAASNPDAVVNLRRAGEQRRITQFITP